MTTAADALAAAVVHHQQGRWADAQAAYRAALQQDPDNAHLWHLFGQLAAEMGDAVLAIELFRQATDLAPESAAYWFSLGRILREQARLADAESCLRQVLELLPKSITSYLELSDVLCEQQKFAESAELLERGLRVEPNSAELHDRLGLTLARLGQLDGAVQCHERAAQARPTVAEYHLHFASALYRQTMLEEATAAFRKTVELAPHWPLAHVGLGNALRDLGDAAQALVAYGQALAADPHCAEALDGRGVCLWAQGQVDQAVACFERACEVQPQFAEALCNLGGALRDQGRLTDAIVAYQKTRTIEPRHARAHSQLLYTLWFCPGLSAADIFHQHREWDRIHAEPLQQAQRPHENDRIPGRRLRVGYLSPNFRHHVQALFLVPLLSAHDRQQVEVIAYSDVATPDGMTQRLRQLVDGWRDVSRLSDQKIAELIRRDQIDVLVDLTMHMGFGRPLVFDMKPAPVQVAWLAYPGTTGMRAMDYRLTDPRLDPPGLFDAHYSERSLRLSESFWCYDPLEPDLEVSPLPANTSGHVTFGCLNAFSKLNPPVLKLWARVLRAIPGARLLLLADEGFSRQAVLGRFRAEQLDIARIEFIPRQPRRQYLETYHRIDIGLDTFPYNGHTTTLDALWMGVPVVSRLGDTVVGRGGLSILHHVNLAHLAAETDEQFVDRAVELASSPDQLAECRASLRQRMQSSPLMDARRFARDMERAFRAMWDTWLTQPRR